MSEETLFVAALDITDAVKRLAFLDEACIGHAELRQRMEVLLRAHAIAGDYLETPPPLISSIPLALGPLEPGMVIDRYRIIRLLGEGGMGSVYLAEQNKPVQRQVALKLIKPGLASPQTLNRFDAERQALAVMDHPNIAKVLDAGSTMTGQPYFVMELVTGVPITEYCDKQCLPPQARLDLFVAVCHAVEHAHQKGIIHRDLKPSNILVAEYDGKPVPKIIDFGVAKALCHSPLEQTFHSIVGMLIGTLEYMSPEQANLSVSDVDTRSDVYSLGVLLYELLTGTTPLQSGQLKRAAVGEALRIIREVDPPKPSTRLSDLRNSVASISAHRHVEPHHLSKTVQCELDWIVMKSLEKDRTRRYASANNFALDVQRYLAHEPVEAGPLSRWYRFRKFVRRNRLAVIATLLILITLIGGIIGTSYGLFQAQAARNVAEQRFDIAQEAVSEFLDKVTDDSDLKKADLSSLRKRLLNSAIPFYQRLIEQKPRGLVQRRVHANAMFRLGRIQSETGELAVAENMLEKARDEYATLLTEQPNVASFQYNLACTLVLLGNIRLELNSSSSALTDYDEAQCYYMKLVAEYPYEPRYHLALSHAWSNSANAHRKQGRSEKAFEAYMKALAISQRLVVDYPGELRFRHSETDLLNNFAACLQENGRNQEAKPLFALNREKLERLVSENNDVNCRRNLAQSLSTEGIMMTQLRDFTTAQKLLERSCHLGEELVREFPSLTEPRAVLGRAYQALGVCHLNTFNMMAGLKASKQACCIQEQLVKDHPSIPDYAIDLAGTYCNMGIMLPAPEAYEWFGKAQTMLEESRRLAPSISRIKFFLHIVFHQRSYLLSTEKRWIEAAQDAEKAVELAPPSNRNERRLMYAVILSQTGRHADAVQEAREVTTINEVKPQDLVMAGIVCALAAERASDDPEAVRRYSEAGRAFFRQAKRHINRQEIENFLKASYLADWDINSRSTYQNWLAEIEKTEIAPQPK